MQITLERKHYLPDYTIGQLSVNGNPLCDTLEGPTSKLLRTDSIADILRQRRLKEHIAIPSGIYEIVINWSNRYSRNMPLLLDVPGFIGVRISGHHRPNTHGLIQVGLNKTPGILTDGGNVFDALYLILEHNAAFRKISLNIK